MLVALLAADSLSPNAVLGHADDIAVVLVALAVIMIGAKLGGALAETLGQPAVLGELLFGVVMGNVALTGLGWFSGFSQLGTINVLAEIGAIILLFSVGLQSSIREMARVGPSAILVALLGVVGPFILGWGVGVLFYPDSSVYMHIFLGAILTATSVGITARVLQDLGRIKTVEARIILGAAVVDDVLGLLILAVVAGVIRAADAGFSMSSLALLWLVVKAVLFFGVAMVVGPFVYRSLYRVASYLHVHRLLLIAALAFCFAVSFAAARAGLAPIVGAFAAGLILEEVQFRDPEERGRHAPLNELLDPIAMFIVPIFFVRMGMGVNLASFASLPVLAFAVVLTLAAIIGKQLSALGVIRARRRSINRWVVGLGMIPRGEVGLIFASLGLTLVYQGRPVVEPGVYAAVVIMVMLTTLATPPILTWAFVRKRGASDASS